MRSSLCLAPRAHPVRYFPRKPSDFDVLSNQYARLRLAPLPRRTSLTHVRSVTDYGDELAPNHPGYHDKEYRARRKYLGTIAFGYKHGQPLPHIDYTKSEVETWGVVFRNLAKLYPTHACKAFNRVFPILQERCGYNEHNIPQLEEVSRFLRETTGWTLRPVAGLLSARDFLNALAFRIFHSTQYIRHPSQPMYTPEPDVCHELLGHVPLYADPDFADFSQELGLASLGATDEQIKELGTVYWYTIEFGLCKEGAGVRAYGAGLLSSFGELEYCLTSKPKLEPFDPFKTALVPYDITNYQPLYFVTESFEDATDRIRAYANSLPRPFTLVYNPFTQTIEVLDTRAKIIKFAAKLQSEMSVLTQSLHRLQ